MSRFAIDDRADMPLEDFRLLRDVINKFCGISFSDDARGSVSRKLRDRLTVHGLPDFSHYYQFLRYHSDARAELEHIADVLTTNETYFFREDYQLKAFVRDVLPALKRRGVERRSQRLVIWSAGCSTGEEAYTLAILIHETGLFHGWDVRIFGSDIARSVVQTARRGVYRGASFRVLPESYSKYFVDVPDGREVREDIKAMVRFGQLNLLDAQRSSIVGQVDVIFCRNVLIYFDMGSRKTVIASFHERLAPGGYLFLGHSESLINVTTAFEIAHLSGDLAYHKPDLSAARPDLPGVRERRK
jgi:chemotaxis protein methyltransferase CheR